MPQGQYVSPQKSVSVLMQLTYLVIHEIILSLNQMFYKVYCLFGCEYWNFTLYYIEVCIMLTSTAFVDNSLGSVWLERMYAYRFRGF